MDEELRKRLVAPYPEGRVGSWQKFDQIRIQIDGLVESDKWWPLQVSWLADCCQRRIRTSLGRKQITREEFDALNSYLTMTRIKLQSKEAVR